MNEVNESLLPTNWHVNQCVGRSTWKQGKSCLGHVGALEVSTSNREGILPGDEAKVVVAAARQAERCGS